MNNTVNKNLTNSSERRNVVRSFLNDGFSIKYNDVFFDIDFKRYLETINQDNQIRFNETSSAPKIERFLIYPISKYSFQKFRDKFSYDYNLLDLTLIYRNICASKKATYTTDIFKNLNKLTFESCLYTFIGDSLKGYITSTDYDKLIADSITDRILIVGNDDIEIFLDEYLHIASTLYNDLYENPLKLDSEYFIEILDHMIKDNMEDSLEYKSIVILKVIYLLLSSEIIDSIIKDMNSSDKTEFEIDTTKGEIYQFLSSISRDAGEYRRIYNEIVRDLEKTKKFERR